MSRLKTGEAKNPTFDSIRRIVQGAGGSMDEMIGIQTPRQPDTHTAGEAEFRRMRNALRDQQSARRSDRAMLIAVCVALLGMVIYSDRQSCCRLTIQGKVYAALTAAWKKQ